MRAVISYDAANDIIIPELIEYSITISSTPLNSNDTSGSVGEFSLSFHRPYDLDNHLNSRSPGVLEGKPVQFNSDYGTIYGLIDTIEEANNETISLQCTSYAGGLNAYNVQAEPLYAYLGYVLDYYFSLGTSQVLVDLDPQLDDRVVTYPGWSGELWHHLKMLCAAEDIQFVLDGQGYVRVEPVRQEEANLIQVQNLNLSTDSSNLAQKVEVREYNCEAVTGALFYPAGGWSEDTEILSVNAGEYTEQTIEMGGSIETFDPPQMYEFVEKDWDESSAYTVVADDGFPVPILQWQDRGGNISFEINEDYQTMTVKMRGANGVRLDDGNEATSFSLALASDSGSGSRYSTLRIVGDGVIHDREGVLSVNTGVPKEVTGTEVGATVDNPFLFDRERVAKAASRVASQFSGALLTAQITATDIGEGFGVTDTGARAVLDGRPYRTRELSYTPGGVSISADDDLTHEDVQEALSGKTYGDVQAENEGLTYRNVFMRGSQYD